MPVPRHQNSKNQPLKAELRDGCRHQNDKRTRRAPDLVARSAQDRDKKTTHNRCVKAPFGANARSDRNRHGKRQGDNRDRQPGKNIRTEFPESVTLGEQGDQFRTVKMGCCGTIRHDEQGS